MFVVGDCLATDEELETSLSSAEKGAWMNLMMWPGNYTVVVSRASNTTILGDLSGVNRVYYARHQDGWWWSNTAKPLAALIGDEVDLTLLALDISVYGIDLFNGRAPFRRVAAIPPGSALQFKDGEPSVIQWYEPTYTTSFSATAEALRNALLDSTRRRSLLEGDVISGDLSGGFDSSGVLAAMSQERSTVGVTHVHPLLSDEDARYARRVAEACSIRQIVAQGDQSTLHYGGLDDPARLPVTDLPAADVFLANYNRQKLQFAAEAGSRHHLTGAGGDSMLDASSTRIADQIMMGDWAGAVRATFFMAHRTECPPWRIARAMWILAHTSHEQSLREVARSLPVVQPYLGRHKPWEHIAWHLPSTGANWLTANAAQEVAKLMRGLLRDMPGSWAKRPGEFHDWTGLLRTGIERKSTVEQARLLGITIHDPYLDAQVIRCCMALPGHIRTSGAGFKPLLSAALPSVIPPFLAARTTKGSFTRMMYAGIKLNEPWLHQLISSSTLIESGVIRKTAAEETLRRAVHGLNAPFRTLHQFVATEIWLQGLVLAEKDWWETNR